MKRSWYITMDVLFLILLFLPLSTCSVVGEDHVKYQQPDPLPSSFTSECVCCEPDSAASSNDPSDISMARIAYLVTVHNERTLEDAALLFQGIRSPNNLIFVHVDAKLDMQAYYDSSLHEEITACPCGSKVFVDSVHSAKWSTWSMNDPTFWGMEQALSHRGAWDVFINLSGDSLPVYDHDVIGRLFGSKLKGINFVTSSSCSTGLLPTNVYHFPEWWHKRGHYTNHPEGDVELDYVNEQGVQESITMEIYFGSQWVALQPDFCAYLVSSLKRKDSLPSRFRDYLIDAGRLMTDETFMPTLLMHVTPFNETSLPLVNSNNGALVSRSDMTALRYERMDENVPTAFGRVHKNQRYDVSESSIADSPKPWGPYFLGIYDLRAIRDSGALFIRKVSQFVEPNLYQVLPARRKEDIPDLFWPNELAVSPKVDWEKRIAKWKSDYEKDKEEQNMVSQEEENDIPTLVDTDKEDL